MRKSIDDKVEKALRTNERTDGRTDIADSRVALGRKIRGFPNLEGVKDENVFFSRAKLNH